MPDGAAANLQRFDVMTLLYLAVNKMFVYVLCAYFFAPERIFSAVCFKITFLRIFASALVQ